MNKINFQNDITKVNKSMMDEFQNNIEAAISDVSTKKATIHITADTAKGAVVTLPLKYFLRRQHFRCLPQRRKIDIEF